MGLLRRNPSSGQDREQDDDRDRDAQQPEKNAFAHDDLLACEN
jgi:hypothetical protein